MRALGLIIAACVVLAMLRYAMILLFICLSILLVWGAIFYTRNIVGFVLVLLACGLVERHPFVTLGIFGLAAFASRKS